MDTMKFKITGMHCRSCKRLIESVLSDLPGVEAADVDETTGLGSLRHDGQIGYDQVEAAVAELKEYKIEPL